ncbi:hypothetical protein UFOVP685_37 [uncultured Caudovirales phage]|uniref:Uncharacterized protein n=1 Tax=uncultured Caudovirales phage TaxID=2100421 RepID=A0A6J5N159_9CAUD|nr:hypothetical protein UFOVP590_47 [uncultured Caudovirales phage]CAB4157622.1 hypothetical protein UFOVP685_37 [uncultured Caudovirales phage]CAB5225342.1 hypothetical protein UFOVP750_15 [uncultured Caudovirales phage]
MSTNENEYEAKLSLKAHIKFLESLLGHIKSNNEVLKARSMWAAWCLHRYFNDGLKADIEKAMKEHGGANEA